MKYRALPEGWAAWLYCLWYAVRKRDWYMVRFELRCGVGNLLCLLRVPGLVRPGEWFAPPYGTRVRVEVTYGSLNVTVNGMRVAFDRVTGEVRGAWPDGQAER